MVLHPRRARPFYGRHPWVYAGAIAAVTGAPADGSEVDLYSHDGQFLARGLYNSRSKIRVRLYAWDADTPLDRTFFANRLQAALRLRGPILGLDRPGQACRLVFSESDGLPGMTVDRYDRWLVVQFTSLGLAQRRAMLTELLVELAGPEGIYLRTERGIGRLEGLELQDGPLWGTVPSEPVIITEDGVQFQVNIAEGQKTGFYLDQRANRQTVGRLAAGRRVLDAFCTIARRASDPYPAPTLRRVFCGKYRALRVLCGVHLRNDDARDAQVQHFSNPHAVIDRHAHDARAFYERGLVILDPPKFARTRNAIEEALRGYRRLQSSALRLLEPDGILVTCCCSGLIQMDMLDELLAQLAAEHRRDVQILERRGQAADHPIAVTCLETNYLKCLISRVH